jgi:glycosyltransferase involved in cell wall biosynthesis
VKTGVLHIGLNLIFCVPGETGGMEVAARSLIPQLASIGDIHLTAFVSRAAAGTFEGVDEVVVPVDARNRLQWVRAEQQFLPGLARRAGCDVVHSLGSTAPLWGAFKRVTTIHDLHYKLAPEAHFGLRGLGMRALIPAAAHRSQRIIALSEATRSDLAEHLRVPRSKIDVVPHGADAPTAAPTPAVRLRADLDLGDRPVLLCVGGRRPHKNAVAVIKALPELDPRPILVITGYRTPYEAELRACAAAAGVAGDVRLPKPLSEADLEGLYALAAGAAVPSLYEGFGLPLLEAMARGVPVACSDRSSLPELAGEAALQFDPQRPEAVVVALSRLLGDEPLRQRLITAGRARAAEFTWCRAAELTASVYRAL